MKRKLMKWFNSFPVKGFAAALIAVGLTGCVIDAVDEIDNVGGADQTDVQDVQITVDIPAPVVPSTRALHYDTAVANIDILVFEKNATPGQPDVLAERVVGTSLKQSESETDDYRVTFVARLTPNADATSIAVIADASAAVTAALAAAPVGTQKQNVLSALKYGGGSDVPMYGEKALTEGVKLEMKITGVSLARSLARIDVENEVEEDFQITTVFVSSYDLGYIAPAWNATTGALLATAPDQPMTPTVAQWNYESVASSGFTNKYFPESPKSNGIEGTSGHINSACLVIGGKIAGDAATHYYRVDFTEGTDAAGRKPGETGFDPSTVAYIPLLRNHFYKVTITAVEGRGFGDDEDALNSLGVLSNLKTTLHVVDQSGIKNMVFNGQHYIGLETDEVEVPAAGGDVSLDVSTNYYNGWETLHNTANHPQGIEYVDGTNWIKSAGGSTFSTVKTTTAGRFPLPFKVDPNLGADSRTAYIHIALNAENATTSRLVHKIKVTQESGIPDPPGGMTKETSTGGGGRAIGPNTYVGAFWKANEKGERLIKIPITTADAAGKWAVKVYSYGGSGIYPITNGNPSDPTEGVSTNFKKGDVIFGEYDGTIPVSIGNPEANPVTGGEEIGGIVEIGDEIAFRIGLKQTWNGSAPRYAVAVITYGFRSDNLKGHHQLLFLRQGEQDDYVMRHSEPAYTGNTMISRPMARKFSPYNLTTETFVDATPEGSDVDHIDIGTRGGTFTKYPTQAGAFFRWAHTEGVFAYNPIVSSSSWDKTNISGVWSTLGATYESCPEGYHRPQDGNINNNSISTVTVNESEMFQSLFSYPESGASASGNAYNSVWGYYADGFFDRHPVGASPMGVANSAVSTSNSSVAYVGGLFHNPTTHNSLFFPANGSRANSTGSLEGAGSSGRYQTSSHESAFSNWHLTIYKLRPFRSYHFSYSAAAIRCVADTEPEPVLQASQTNLTYGYQGESKTITVTSHDGRDAKNPVAWEVEYDTDGDGFDDAKPDWLTLTQDGGLGTGGTGKEVSISAAVMPHKSDNLEDRSLKAAYGATPVNNENGSSRFNLASRQNDVNTGETTANCYVVNASGRYKLPLVYGNALVGGADNRSAYTHNGGGDPGIVLEVFKNHLDNNITSPYISAHASYNNATLIWQDSPDLVTNVGLDGDYLVFDVKDADICQGNAIVAVRQGTTILWSWHIWVTPTTIFNADATVTANTFQTTGKYPVEAPTRYRMMNYNLGWVTGKEVWYGEGDGSDEPRNVTIRITQTGIASPVTTEVTVAQSTGIVRGRGNNPYYQWGRKDPLRPSNGGLDPETGAILVTETASVSTAKPIYWGSDYIGVEAGLDYGVAATAAARLGDAIQNPYIFYYGSFWFTDMNYYNRHNNLWDADNYSDTAVEEDYQSVKTIYDPSPAGYKIPLPDTWSRFSGSGIAWSNSVENTKPGANLSSGQPGDGSSFFPASGTHAYNTGALSDIGTYANYWSALPRGIDIMASTLTFAYRNNSLSPVISLYRSYGLSVRPVADE